MDDYVEYEVHVKDRRQNCTHVVHEYAANQNEANAKALEELRALLGYDELEVI